MPSTRESQIVLLAVFFEGKVNSLNNSLEYHSDEWYRINSDAEPTHTGATAALESVEAKDRSWGPMPTYRELCSEFGWASTGTVRDHLRALAQKGYVRLSGGRSRAISLVEGVSPATSVAVVGTISAGIPVLTEESGNAFIAVPSEWVSNGSFFAVKVSGDSMKDAGILDGDFVIARAQSIASEGDIVVATLHGETTLKRLKKRASQWFLIPENRRYRAISVPADTPAIQGIMVGLLRGVPPKNTGWLLRR